MQMAVGAVEEKEPACRLRLRVNEADGLECFTRRARALKRSHCPGHAGAGGHSGGALRKLDRSELFFSTLRFRRSSILLAVWRRTLPGLPTLAAMISRRTSFSRSVSAWLAWPRML